MSELEPLIPPRVKKLLAQYEREAERKKDRAAKKFITLMALGKKDRAIEALMEAMERGEDAGLGVVGQKHLMAAELGAMLQPKTDRSPLATETRQRKLVEFLTSGSRCSLARAIKHAGYGRHRGSWDKLLESRTIVALFQEAVDAGRQLPPKFTARIMAAIEDYALGIRA